MSTPLTISFVVPIYNIEKIRNQFDEFIQSLLAQTYPHTEIIFVNDASPDNSADILQDLAAQHSHIRILTHSRNQGQGPARNTGAAAATGDYIWFVDQDDLVAPNACQILTDEAQNYGLPDIICFYTCTEITSLNSTPPTLPSQYIDYEDYSKSKQHRIDIDNFLLHLYAGISTPWRQIIKTDIARSFQFPNFSHEDVVYISAIVAHANRLLLVGAYLYFWRHHDFNTHKTRDFKATITGYIKASQAIQEIARQFDHKKALQRYMIYHPIVWLQDCAKEIFYIARLHQVSKTQRSDAINKLAPETWRAKLRLVQDTACYVLYLRHCQLLTSAHKPKPSSYAYYCGMVKIFIRVAVIKVPSLLLYSFSPSVYCNLQFAYTDFRKTMRLNS